MERLCLAEASLKYGPNIGFFMGDLSATRGAIAGGELEQDEGQVKILPMMDGGAWNAQLCPALSDPEFPGRGDERLARIIEQHVSGECSKADAAKAKGR